MSPAEEGGPEGGQNDLSQGSEQWLDLEGGSSSVPNGEGWRGRLGGWPWLGREAAVGGPGGGEAVTSYVTGDDGQGPRQRGQGRGTKRKMGRTPHREMTALSEAAACADHPGSLAPPRTLPFPSVSAQVFLPGCHRPARAWSPSPIARCALPAWPLWPTHPFLPCPASGPCYCAQTPVSSTLLASPCQAPCATPQLSPHPPHPNPDPIHRQEGCPTETRMQMRPQTCCPITPSFHPSLLALAGPALSTGSCSAEATAKDTLPDPEGPCSTPPTSGSWALLSHSNHVQV